MVAGDRVQGGIEGSARSQLSWFRSGNLTADQAILLSVSALLVLLVWGRWRYDIVALGALFTASYSNWFRSLSCSAALVIRQPSPWCWCSIVSYGLTKSGAVDYLIPLISRLRHHPAHQRAHFLAAILSMFMNNVGALALLMPVAIESASKAGGIAVLC